MAYDYINYVTSKPGTPLGPAPSQASAALRHAGDELLQRFPIFFRRWPRVFRDVTEETACSTLLSILDEHFSQTRRRDLAWSAILSVFVLAGQMALHCQQNGMNGVLPQLQQSVGSYVERVICPEIRDKGGWVSRQHGMECEQIVIRGSGGLSSRELQFSGHLDVGITLCKAKYLCRGKSAI